MGERGRVITLKKKLSFAKISTSSGASQAGLWITTSQFWDFNSYQTCFSCPCTVTLCQTLRVKLGRHTILRISVRMLNPSTPCICQPPHLQIFTQMGSVHLMEKVHGKFCTCLILSSRHELNSKRHKSDFLLLNPRVLIATLKTLAAAARRTIE